MAVNESDPAARQAHARARARYPDVELTVERFAEHLARTLPPGADLAALATDDLFLACACLDHQAPALAHLERELADVVGAAVGPFGKGSGLTDEVRQAVRILLLVDSGAKRPLLADFAGRGALRRFIRVLAVRESMRIRDAHKRLVGIDDDAMLDALVPPSDPALSQLRAGAAAVLRAAFLAAVASLEPRERSALRMHLIDGLTIDQLAPVFRVHRATCARWIAGARDALVERTRRTLMKDLALGPLEVDSLIRLVGSRLDLSLSEPLRSRG